MKYRFAAIAAAGVLFFLTASEASAEMLTGRVHSHFAWGRSMTILSESSDKGTVMEYKLVWDKESPYADLLAKTRIGEKLTVEAERHPITRNWKVKLVQVEAPAVHIRTLSGEIRRIVPAQNYMLLDIVDPSGRKFEQHFIWDKDLEERWKLDRARIGQRLRVQADHDIFTGHWKIHSLV